LVAFLAAGFFVAVVFLAAGFLVAGLAAAVLVVVFLVPAVSLTLAFFAITCSLDLRLAAVFFLIRPFLTAVSISLCAALSVLADGLLMKALNTTKNSQKMTQNMKSFTETLKKQFPKVTTAQLYTINNFVTYGTESTAKLSAKERFALVTAYVKANKKLPNSEADWAKLLALKK
jgi:ABC-type multidrug transport system fused ATPase/permease subunit